MFNDDVALEIARTMRELEERVVAKLRSTQTGEIWKDLPQPADRPIKENYHDKVSAE